MTARRPEDTHIYERGSERNNALIALAHAEVALERDLMTDPAHNMRPSVCEKRRAVLDIAKQCEALGVEQVWIANVIRNATAYARTTAATETNAHTASYNIQMRRQQLNYVERQTSCAWCPTERRLWREVGYRDGLTIYPDNNVADIQHGIEKYGRVGRMAHGSYEQGIHDALVDRLARMQEPTPAGVVTRSGLQLTMF